MQNKKKSTSRNRVSLKAIKKTKFGLSQLLKRPSEKKSQTKTKKRLSLKKEMVNVQIRICSSNAQCPFFGIFVQKLFFIQKAVT
jgi:hypothetical protein